MLGKAVLEEGQFVEDGPARCIKRGGDCLPHRKSLSCLSGWARPGPPARASSLCLHRVVAVTCICEQPFILSGISDHSGAGYLWRFSMQYVQVSRNLFESHYLRVCDSFSLKINYT